MVVSSEEEDIVNQLLYDGLTVLQHRGQDAAGIMTENNKKFHLRKSNGLVKDVFYKKHMTNLLGSSGIGHVGYPAGTSSVAEAWPFYVDYHSEFHWLTMEI